MTYLLSADDLGLNLKVNQRIKKLLVRGNLQIVSILTNLPNSQEAIRLYQRYRSAELGLHWNLVEGKPVLPANRVRSLVQKNGFFYPLPVLLLKTILGKIRLTEVELELEAQWRVLAEKVIKVTHFNSHQNVHLFPPYDRIAIKVIKKFRIKKIREEATVRYRLKYLPMKLMIFELIQLVMQLRFGTKVKFDGVDELMIHPGTSYDPPSLIADHCLAHINQKT